MRDEHDVSVRDCKIDTRCAMKCVPLAALVLLQLVLLPVCFSIKNNLLPVQLMDQVPINYWMFTPWPILIAALLAVGICLSCAYKKKFAWPTVKLQFVLILFFALFFLLVNPFLLKNWMHAPMAIMFAVAGVALSIGCMRAWAVIIWVPIFLFAFITYGLDINNVVINRTIMVQILETSRTDALRYATFLNIALLVIAIIISILLSYALWRVVRNVKRLSLLSFGSVVLVLPLLGMYCLRGHMVSNSMLLWPMFNLQEYVVVYKDAIREKNKTNYIFSLLPDDSKNLNTSISTVDEDSGIVVILHIGESVNASHCSINGYERNTTPWLASQPSLINFKDCVSSAPLTDWAVFSMVTNGRRSCLTTTDKAMLPSSPSVMDFFHANGFRCFGFWDKCYVDGSTNNIFSRMVNYYCRCAEKQFGYIGDVMNQLRDVLTTLDTSGKSNIFLMLNNDGSHSYYNSYNKKNPPFPVSAQPSATFRPQSNPVHAENIVNAYDSTIHYTDCYIQRIAEHLKGKPFIYVYMSDHGEYMGENGYWNRGTADFYNYHRHDACKVPFFIFASPEFEAFHPHFKQSLAQLRRSQHLLTGHEHLFHTLLGIMGISSDYYDSSLDLSKEGVRPYEGLHPGVNNQ